MAARSFTWFAALVVILLVSATDSMADRQRAPASRLSTLPDARLKTQPAVHSRGSLAIPQTHWADFDTGRVQKRGADIIFAALSATHRRVEPRNGARLGFAGTKVPEYRKCADAAVSTGSVDEAKLKPGTYVCIRTDRGRFGFFRVTAPIGKSPGTLKVVYVLWKKQPDLSTTKLEPVLKLHRKGSITLPQTFVADLDRGRVMEYSADIYFQVRSTWDRILRPWNSAQLRYMGAQKPSYDQCRTMTVSAQPINIKALKKGVHVCFRTDEGRLGFFWVVKPVGKPPSPGDPPAELGIRFITWAN